MPYSWNHVKHTIKNSLKCATNKFGVLFSVKDYRNAWKSTQPRASNKVWGSIEYKMYKPGHSSFCSDIFIATQVRQLNMQNNTTNYHFGKYAITH